MDEKTGKAVIKSTLDFSGYLERGYTAVASGFRNQSIGLKVIQGLIERSEGQNVYVTIDMDNPWPLDPPGGDGARRPVHQRPNRP